MGCWLWANKDRFMKQNDHEWTNLAFFLAETHLVERLRLRRKMKGFGRRGRNHLNSPNEHQLTAPGRPGRRKTYLLRLPSGAQAGVESAGSVSGVGWYRQRPARAASASRANPGEATAAPAPPAGQPSQVPTVRRPLPSHTPGPPPRPASQLPPSNYSN